MRTVFAVAALLAALPTLALAQGKPLLLANPADANRDGVVTEAEKADYLAKKAGDPHNAAALPVSAPKPVGNSVVFKPTELQDPERNTTAAGEPPAAASDFEKQLETRIRKDAEDDR